jgi:chemotaxis protein MotB
MSDSAFFDSGKANISGDAKVALGEVCEIIVEYTDLIQIIHIEGHTDDVPQMGPEYEDNWALSYGRADTVRKFIFSETDIAPELVSVTYYSEYQPVADNDTEEGRRQNRRVDFVIESILKDSGGN